MKLKRSIDENEKRNRKKLQNLWRMRNFGELLNVGYRGTEEVQKGCERKITERNTILIIVEDNCVGKRDRTPRISTYFRMGLQLEDMKIFLKSCPLTFE